jgi:hypothetical protein
MRGRVLEGTSAENAPPCLEAVAGSDFLIDRLIRGLHMNHPSYWPGTPRFDRTTQNTDAHSFIIAFDIGRIADFSAEVTRQ